jgi:hypothetical protein
MPAIFAGITHDVPAVYEPPAGGISAVFERMFPAVYLSENKVFLPAAGPQAPASTELAKMGGGGVNVF